MIPFRPASSTLNKLLAVAFILVFSFDNTLNASDNDDFQHHYDKAKSLFSKDIDTAIDEGKTAIDIAFELKDIEKIGKSNWLMGWLYRRKGDLVNAFNYYLGARRAYLRLEDWDNVEQLEENIGSVAFDNRSYNTAISRWKMRLKTAEKLEDKYRIASAHFDLGLAYKKERVFEKAIYHQSRARMIFEANYRIQDSTELARVYNELGINYYWLITSERSSKWVDSCSSYYLKASELDGSTTMKAITLNNYGDLNFVLDSLPNALGHYMAARDLNRNIGNERLEMANLVNIGEVYYQLGILDSSLNYLSRAIEYEYDGVVNNHNDLEKALDIDRGNRLVKAVALIDSVQKNHPQFVTSMRQMTFFETVTKLKVNMVLIQNKDNDDLIQLANEEAEADFKKELLFARVKLWIVLCLGLMILSFLIFNLIKWRKSKQSIKKDLTSQRIETEKRLKNLGL